MSFLDFANKPPLIFPFFYLVNKEKFILKTIIYFFRGVSKSNIFFNATLSKWILQSLINPDFYLESQYNKLPIGTTHWKKTGVLSKRDDHASVIPLTFSFCYPDKFTCNSGHCKPLTDRCNIKLNCKDKSDEINCDAKLKIENDYNKEVVPVSQGIYRKSESRTVDFLFKVPYWKKIKEREIQKSIGLVTLFFYISYSFRI